LIFGFLILCDEDDEEDGRERMKIVMFFWIWLKYHLSLLMWHFF